VNGDRTLRIRDLQSKAVISGRAMITKGFLVTLFVVLFTKAG